MLTSTSCPTSSSAKGCQADVPTPSCCIKKCLARRRSGALKRPRFSKSNKRRLQAGGRCSFGWCRETSPSSAASGSWFRIQKTHRTVPSSNMRSSFCPSAKRSCRLLYVIFCYSGSSRAIFWPWRPMPRGCHRYLPPSIVHTNCAQLPARPQPAILGSARSLQVICTWSRMVSAATGSIQSVVCQHLSPAVSLWLHTKATPTQTCSPCFRTHCTLLRHTC